MHLPRPLWIALTILISLLWAANIIIGYIDPDRVQNTVNVIFGAIVGTLYWDAPKVREARKKIGSTISGKPTESGEDP